MLDAELAGLAMAKKLVVEPPVLSWFLFFNLVSFLAVGAAGVIKFKSNSRSLARLSFCLAVSISLIYQLPLVIFSQRLESSLAGAWDYALVVNGAAMLLMLWTFLSRRLDVAAEDSVYPERVSEIHLIAGVLGIALMWAYMSAIPWDCTALYALVVDPPYTMLARELGVKLLGTSLATYALGAFDLPGFSGPMISRKMAPNPRGAYEKKSIHGRADGHGAARSGPHHGGRGGQEAQGQRAHDLRLA